ncbi:hypothetical protein Pmani_036758 [Petrolisthes manimaculis]|uniref:Uncharacterized protein n=1 Tax=Petrolisthes manimaculis TaxID=1843537 RepID=A0AAE1TLU7_9EUCA|nr:hypothetical protein Pmani_036758 [Petrolisthes manimaculis]
MCELGSRAPSPSNAKHTAPSLPTPNSQPSPSNTNLTALPFQRLISRRHHTKQLLPCLRATNYKQRTDSRTTSPTRQKDQKQEVEEEEQVKTQKKKHKKEKKKHKKEKKKLKKKKKKEKTKQKKEKKKHKKGLNEEDRVWSCQEGEQGEASLRLR